MKISNIEIKGSLNFMGCSLDKLVSNLKEKGKKEKRLFKKHSLIHMLTSKSLGIMWMKMDLKCSVERVFIPMNT